MANSSLKLIDSRFEQLQGEEVLHNVGQGVIITNGSLVLQKVTRDQAGSYTCEASNVEGDEVSKPVAITIMCKSILLVASHNILKVELVVSLFDMMKSIILI